MFYILQVTATNESKPINRTKQGRKINTILLLVHTAQTQRHKTFAKIRTARKHSQTRARSNPHTLQFVSNIGQVKGQSERSFINDCEQLFLLLAVCGCFSFSCEQ